jgi:integrase
MRLFTLSQQHRRDPRHIDELRLIWKGTAPEGDRGDVYGALVRFILLTAARRKEAARMIWRELEGDDWIIPAVRHKGKNGVARDHVVPLSARAREVLASLPKFENCPYVFTPTGRKHINNFSHDQEDIKRKTGTADWTLHDLRRTARTLMSRRGVTVDSAERALGHVMGGVRGTYDRYAYHREKAEAFEALATQIDLIVKPPVGNVVNLTVAP